MAGGSQQPQRALLILFLMCVLPAHGAGLLSALVRAARRAQAAAALVEDPLDAFMAAEVAPEIAAKEHAEEARRAEQRRQRLQARAVRRSLCPRLPRVGVQSLALVRGFEQCCAPSSAASACRPVRCSRVCVCWSP